MTYHGAAVAVGGGAAVAVGGDVGGGAVGQVKCRIIGCLSIVTRSCDCLIGQEGLCWEGGRKGWNVRW